MSNATLRKVIDYLSTLPRDMEVSHGFGNPHSYRGHYADLAFEPVDNTTVGAMLDAAKAALGRTYAGWKGGNYTMKESTDCWLAHSGSTGVPIVLPGTPAVYVLPRGERDGER